MPLCSQLPSRLRSVPLPYLPTQRNPLSLILPTHLRNVRRFTCFRAAAGDADSSFADSNAAAIEKKLTTRARKKLKRNPNETLLESIQDAGYADAMPSKWASKTDLSYTNATTMKPKTKQIPKAKQLPHHDAFSLPQPLSLQTILSSYIRQTNLSRNSSESGETPADKDNPRPKVHFSTQERELLHSQRYDEDDVKQWASILRTRNMGGASRKLFVHTGKALDEPGTTRKPLPLFVFLHLLRRTDVSPQALKNLLIYAWHQLHRKKSRETFQSGVADDWEYVYPVERAYPTLNGSNAFLMIVRLLQLARKTWPEALVTVTAMATQHIFASGDLDAELSSRSAPSAVARLTARYNRILALLSLPSRSHPFHSVVFYHRAQFDLLSRMAEHDPPIAITREGYHSIASVQLAHMKTARERDWDSLKAKSWPPWKEEKTGLDAEKDAEYGVSRALEAIRRSREAGYGGVMWDNVAQILSGWDVDGSPTIQTRALVLHGSVSRGLEPYAALDELGSRKSADTPNDNAIWASRIRATRTVYEAWAAFLAAEDRIGHPGEDVYFAMLEKLAAEANRQRQLSTHDVDETLSSSPSQTSLGGGDAKEVFPQPTSPRAATYVRKELPSLDQLAEEMFASGIVLNGYRSSFLITNAETLDDGLKYYEVASERFPRFKSLLAKHPQNVQDVPDRVFSAFLALLCRFPAATPVRTTANHGLKDTETFRSHLRFQESPYEFALRLLRSRRPKYRPPYHHMLGALARGKFHLLRDGVLKEIGWSERYLFMRDIIKEMDAARLQWDLETVRAACVALHTTLLWTEDNLHTQYDYRRMQELVQAFKDDRITTTEKHRDDLVTPYEILKDAAVHIRKQFTSIIHHRDRVSSRLHDKFRGEMLPHLFATFNPAVLHAYVRTLGTFQDWAGIIELLRWMRKHQDDIKVKIGVRRNDHIMFRKVFTGMRVFLERSWSHQSGFGGASEQSSQGVTGTAASIEIIEQVKGLVTSVEIFGGWPSDEEVAVYCHGRDFPNV